LALLNLTAFTPQMAYSVCSTLTALGGTAGRDELERWMSPAAIYSDDARPRTAGLGLREAISLCETLDLIVRENGSLSLPENFESLQHFRTVVLQRVLAPERNTELFSGSPTGGVRAHELTRALTWFGQLRATTGPYSTANYERYQDQSVRVIENNTRWNVFDRWVVFLGFGWRIADGVVPDPTSAALAALDDLLPVGEEVPLPSVLAQLAARLPVIEGGAYHNAYLEAIGARAKWDERRLSEPLSLALIRLERRGILELFGGGDAESRVLRLGADVDRSHQFVKRVASVGAAESV
jgi:hypothetical protein